MQRRTLLSVAVLCIVSALLISSGALAETPSGAGLDASSGPWPVWKAISYQGYLVDDTGQPITGTHDLAFAMYDAPNGVTPFWSDTDDDVEFDKGHFAVKLPVTQSDFDGRAVFLEVEIDGQTLDVWQEVLPVPYALSLVPGATIGKGASHALRIDADGLTGLYASTTSTLASSSAVTAANYGGQGDGLTASSDGRAAVHATGMGMQGIGVEAKGYMVGVSAEGYGPDGVDIILSGGSGRPDDDGVITTDPDVITSSMVLRSNGMVRVDLDDNGDEAGAFIVRDDAHHEVFSVEENGEVYIGGDAHMYENKIVGMGFEVARFELIPNDTTIINIPRYCERGMCQVFVVTDGNSGQVFPGIMMAAQYLQMPDGSWYGGPSAPVGGVLVSDGMGTNGDQVSNVVYFSGLTDSSGGVFIYDDLDPETSDWQWTATFTAVPGEIEYAEVFIAPIGVPGSGVMPVSMERRR